MLEIWQSILPGSAIGPDSDFSDLGGGPKLAAQLAARASHVFGMELDQAALPDPLTPAAMAAQVEAELQPAAVESGASIVLVERAADRPLSFAQERIWFMQQLDPHSAAYNLAATVRLRGELDPAVLEAAFTELVRRHESLRATFALADGQPRHSAAAAQPFHLPVVAVDGAAEALLLAGQAAQEPFDLAVGPLLRATLLQLGDDDQVLLLSTHHLVADTWTMSLLVRELLALYQAAQRGEMAELPDWPVQFADFAAWQRAAAQADRWEGELAYWRQKLAGLDRLELPLDHPRPTGLSYHGALETADLDPAVLWQLRQISQLASATLSMTLLAAFQVLLRRYTGQGDLAVGVPSAGRRDAALQGLAGPLANTLVLRADLSGGPTFREALAGARRAWLEACAHSQLPFARLVAELNPERGLSYTPLVQTAFDYRSVPPSVAPIDGLDAGKVELIRTGTQFDLALTVVDLAGRERLVLDYNADLFEPATAQRLLGHYANLLRAIASDPGQPIATLALMDEDEQRQVLRDWNDNTRPYPKTSLAELFEAQAARTPDAPALIFCGQSLSYKALNRRANQIARYLQSLGLSQGDFVGVCLERSFDQLASVLAALKAGAAFLPLDPTYPAARLGYILADSHARVVLTQTRFLGLLREPLAAEAPAAEQARCTLIALDAMAEALSAQSSDNLGLTIPIDAPAYLVYTSGSTGRPKGVVAPHRGAINHCQWVWDFYPFAPGEVVCQKTSLSFVDAVVEIFGPLLCGVPQLLVPEAMVKDPVRLVNALAEYGVTRLMLLPSLLRAMLTLTPNLRERLPRLNLWAAGSEVLGAGLVEDFLAAMPGAVLLNLCGSSEDGGDVTCYDCRQPRPAGVVPIGRPLSNTQIYVLDAATMTPVPIGVMGEIFAGGDGLALGYHERPELNAERFVPNPFSDQPGARLYRTGDLGRFLPDGNLLYLGRRDRQVKVRGVRIELDEVQAVLALHPALEACAVRVHERGSGSGAELAAYYVTKPGTALVPGELRQHLARHLPENMLPGWIVRLDEMPVLPNGKVNLHALPVPDMRDFRRHAGEMVRPRTLLEASLARLWAEVLAVPEVGVTDNFFELGGHSLLAASLFERLRTELGLELPLALLFSSPTIAELADCVMQGGNAPIRLASLVPLKPKGSRPPFFCVHPLGGGVGDYEKLAAHLDPQQPFYGLRAKGIEDERFCSSSFEELAADYLAEIRTVQPNGPYRLGGYSSGGLLAFEMARQLAELGQPVALVALLDSYAPIPRGEGRLRPAALVNIATTLPQWLTNLSKLERQRLLDRVRRWVTTAHHSEDGVTAADFFSDDELARLPARHRTFIDAHLRAEVAYQPRPYPGQVTVFRAHVQALRRAGDRDKGWGALALGGVDIREFPGSHHTLFQEPWVEGLAQALQTKLDELEKCKLRVEATNCCEC